MQVRSGAIPAGVLQGVEMLRRATASTMATPATSSDASPTPTNSQREGKDYEVASPLN
jgi:hypothetical protein